GYGDSGIPNGYAYSHNFMPLYGIECARKAAIELGQSQDDEWLSQEYTDYREAIMTSINRSVRLEEEGPPYLPAMPTYPQRAYSQAFLAVFPTGIFAPEDPLVTGHAHAHGTDGAAEFADQCRLDGCERRVARQSMSIAEAYLLRGDMEKTVNLLLAAL